MRQAIDEENSPTEKRFTSGKVRRHRSSVPTLWLTIALGLPPLPLAEAGEQSLVAGASGVIPEQVLCRNLSTGVQVVSAEVQTGWNCTALGVSFAAGDRATTAVRGVAGQANRGSRLFGGAVPLLVPHVVTEGGVSDVAAADLDGDGDTDLVYVQTLVWLENDGNDPPGFTEHRLEGLDESGDNVRVSDVNADEAMDLVVNFKGLDHGLVWFQNLGGRPAQFLQRPIDSETGWWYEEIEAVDVDGDGDGDVVAVRSELPQGLEQLVWLENDGNAFQRHLLFESVGEQGDSSKIATGDLNGSGAPDIVFLHRPEAEVWWYENRGGVDPLFEPRFIDRDFYGNPVVLDADADGDLDFVAGIAISFKKELRSYQNEGGEPPSFKSQVIGSFSDRAFRFGAGDLSGDGLPELLLPQVFGSDVHILLLENLGGSPLVFQEHPMSSAGEPDSPVVADVDGDGRKDIVGSNSDEGFWLENRMVVGGWVVNLEPRRVTCVNRTRGQIVSALISERYWDCEALGLVVEEGDQVETRIRGTME